MRCNTTAGFGQCPRTATHMLTHGAPGEPSRENPVCEPCGQRLVLRDDMFATMTPLKEGTP